MLMVEIRSLEVDKGKEKEIGCSIFEEIGQCWR